MKYAGFVAAISARDLPSKFKGKKSTAYSFKLENDDGSEGPWIGFGFDEPPFQQGDYVEVEAEENDKGFLNYIKGSGKQIKNPPARATAKPAGRANGSASTSAGSVETGAGTTATTAGSAVSGQNSTGVDRQTQIVLQHSQEMAIAAVNVLLTHDGLPMTEAKTKAGTAKRYAEFMAMIDKLTRKFYDDVVTGQLLTRVAPEIVSTEPDAPLPEPPKTTKKVTVGVADAVPEPGVF